MSGRRKLWAIALSVMVTMGVGVGLLYAKSGNSSSLAEYRVADLTCRACVQKINRALESLPGVGRVDVNVEAGRAQVEFDPSQSDPGRIRDAIMTAGYPAFLVRTASLDSGGGGARVAPAGSSAGGKGGCACCERN